jgi:hypothetical protein
MASVQTRKVGFAHRFGRRAPLLMVSRKQMEPSSGASVTLKIDKNGLQARYLRPPKVRGGHFNQKFLITAHRLF